MYKYKIKTPVVSAIIVVYHSKIHYYPTRFALEDNYTVVHFNKASSQRSICYQGCKFWKQLQIIREVVKCFSIKSGSFSI